MSDRIADPRPLERNRLDRDEPEPIDEDSAPAAKAEVIAAPRRIRSELVKLDGQILGHQDIAEALYPFVRDSAGRKLLNRLHGGLEETHRLSRTITDMVERG